MVKSRYYIILFCLLTIKKNQAGPTLNQHWFNVSSMLIYSSYIAHILCSVTRPVHPCTISTPVLEHTALLSAAISALGAYRTHCRLRPTRYSLTPEWSETHESKVPCPRKQHRIKYAPALRGKNHDISQNTKWVPFLTRSPTWDFQGYWDGCWW